MITFTKSFKYLAPFILYVLAYFAFKGTGLVCWYPIFFTFLIIPFAELFIKADATNLDEVEEDLAKKNKSYDFVLYVAVGLQYYSLWLFLHAVQVDQLSNWDQAGRIASMGLLCGAFGINVAHELGHRVNKFEQLLAKMLLLRGSQGQAEIEKTAALIRALNKRSMQTQSGIGSTIGQNIDQ
jgi:alkane 1-monooxygenase